MAALETYEKIDEKNNFFRSSSIVPDNTINDVETFNKWYSRYTGKIAKRQKERDKAFYFFRGVSEAKHKLYNSAQRVWLTKDIDSWDKKVSYITFLKKFIASAKQDHLLKRVFDFYNVSEQGQDFPILSILQHYGSPTPLMDWTLDIDVALFFAIDEMLPQNLHSEIDNYFSLYIIDNERSKIQSITSIADYEYRSLDYVINNFRLTETATDNLFYLSDYETNNSNRRHPLTTIYNQNIIPQKGLFIFNPLPEVPLEKFFSKTDNKKPAFRCFNIKKDLTEYIKRKIASKGINRLLIYPELKTNTNGILQQALNSYFK